MQISRNIVNGPKSNNIGFGRNLGYCLHPETISPLFCRPSVHYACLRLCSEIVHFIRNNCFYIVCCGWSEHALTALVTLPFSVAWQNCCRSSKTAVVNIQAFRHLIMSQQEKGKLRVCWTSIHNKKLKVFLRTLCTFAILV